MRVILAFLLPPLAVFTTGKMGQFVLSFFLTMMFWIPGVIHALMVINQHNTEQVIKKHR